MINSSIRHVCMCVYTYAFLIYVYVCILNVRLSALLDNEM